MIDHTVRDGADFLLIGSVRGLAAELPKLLERLEAFRPEVIGLGLSDEEAKGIRDYFVGSPAEPLVFLSPTETAEVKGLTRYGEVQVPNPSYRGVMQWGAERGIEVRAIDPSDDRYAEMFAAHIGYTELVRRTLRERRLSRRPPSPGSADEFSLDWSRPPSARGGSARLARAREEIVVAAARSLGSSHRRVAVVVDRERFPDLVAAFDRGAGAR